jgi:hypothetical protein
MTVDVVVVSETEISVTTESSETIVVETPATPIVVSVELLGAQGVPGPEGESYEQDFETVSKNLKSWNASFTYDAGKLVSISYTDGTDTILKTFNYTGDKLTSLVLSGDTPSGIALTKTFAYTGDSLTGVSYT